MTKSDKQEINDGLKWAFIPIVKGISGVNAAYWVIKFATSSAATDPQVILRIIFEFLMAYSLTILFFVILKLEEKTQ